MHKVTNVWLQENQIKIEWNLGKRCNYDCSYCPSIIHDNNSSHTNIDLLKNTVDKLVSINKKIKLSLTGGEPCVHPHIETLINYIISKDIWLSITTNGTRKFEWYAQQNVNHYVFSLHFEYDWQTVLNTIIKLSKVSKSIILVNVMAHHEKIEEVKNAVSNLNENNINYVIRRIRWTENDHDNFDDNRYNEEDLKWILSHTAAVKPNVIIYHDENKKEYYHANDVIKLHKNKFKNWLCNAGIESLMINWDGDVHRATCRVGGSLGNIYKGTFQIPNSSIICTREWCTCAADIPLTKQKVE